MAFIINNFNGLKNINAYQSCRNVAVTLEIQQNDMKKIKLEILKIAAIAACKIAIAADIKKYPAEWLLHYLQGKGGEKKVPEEVVVQALPAIKTVIRNDGKIEGWHCLSHSSIYEGSGFGGRPDLFYIMGGFSFYVNSDGKIAAKDVYDWHPNSDGEYFTSPFGGEKFEWLYKLLDKMFGEDWFSNNNVTGVYGVSNKLWSDMTMVGAKSFTSTFKTMIDVSAPESKINLMKGKNYSSPFVIDDVSITNNFVIDGEPFYFCKEVRMARGGIPMFFDKNGNILKTYRVRPTGERPKR